MDLRSSLNLVIATLGALTMGSATVAHAHVCLLSPVPRACDFLQQKQGPCGARVGRSPTKVTTFRPGETITVQIEESVDHPSHYRVAFNPSGDKFEDPVNVNDKNGKHPYVILDNIPDSTARRQEFKVTLPNITTDNATLQLIQVMYDKGGNGFAGNDGVGTRGDDVYYSCADIVLKGDPVPGAPPPPDAGTKSAVGPDAATSVPATEADAGAATPAALIQGDLPVDGLDLGQDEGGAEAEAGGCAVGAGANLGDASWFVLGLGLLCTRRRRTAIAKS